MLSIDIGGRSLKYSLLNETDGVFSQGIVEFDTSLGVAELVGVVGDLVESLGSPDDVVLIGIPGVIDLRKGLWIHSSAFDVRLLHLTHFVDSISEQISDRVIVCRDSDAAAVGSRASGRSVHVQIGTGLGVTLMRNGLPIHGHGSEVGHVGGFGPESCSCGASGCLAANLFAARAADQMARMGSMLARALAVTVAALSPGEVSLGGGGLTEEKLEDVAAILTRELESLVRLSPTSLPSVRVVADPRYVGVRGLAEIAHRYGRRDQAVADLVWTPASWGTGSAGGIRSS